MRVFSFLFSLFDSWQPDGRTDIQTRVRVADAFSRVCDSHISRLLAMTTTTTMTISRSVALFLSVCLSFPSNASALQLTGPGYKVGTVSAGPLEISALGFGTWSWGNRLLFDYDPSRDEDIYEAYAAVRDAGVSVFDTADSYGTLTLNGRAEILLGQFERRYLASKEEEGNADWFRNILPQQTPVVRKQQVATKFAPYPWRVTSGSMINAAKDSLERLEQDKLAIAQLHWSTSKYQPFQEKALWEGISDVYDEGLCEAVGVSNYGPLQLQKVSERFRERNVPLAVAQIQYSLMTFQECKDMNAVCDDVGCRLISYSPLCLGLLTGKYNVDNLPKTGNPRRQLFRELLPGAQGLLNTLEVIGKDYGKTQAQVAINWAVCKGTVPIPGARTGQMAQDNLGAIGWNLKPDAMEELDRAALGVGKPMIQNIFQTK